MRRRYVWVDGIYKYRYILMMMICLVCKTLFDMHLYSIRHFLLCKLGIQLESDNSIDICNVALFLLFYFR